MKKLIKPVLLISIGLALMIHVSTLLSYPSPFADEAWLASRAWGYIQDGRAFGPLDAGVIDRIEGYSTFLPWTPTVIQSLGIRLFNSPTLLGLRIISIISGIILLGVIYLIGNYFGGNVLGLISVLVTIISRPFFISAHLGRVDILAATFGFSAIAITLYNKRANYWLALLAGLACGIAFEIHANSAIYIPVIGMVFIYKYRGKFYKMPDFWGFTSGVFIGIVFYYFLHIAPNPQSFLQLNKVVFVPTNNPPIFTLDPKIIFSSFIDILTIFAVCYPFTFPLIALAFFYIIFQDRRSFLLLIINAMLLLGVVLLVRNKIFYYAILFTPALDIAIAWYIFKLLYEPWKRTKAEFLLRVLTGVFIIFTLLLNLRDTRVNSWKQYQLVQNQINEIVKPDEKIMGDQLYWLGLYVNPYLSWEELIFYQRYKDGSNLEDAFRELSPDIFIIDRQVRTYIIGEHEAASSYRKELELPQRDLERILTKHGKLLAQFDNPIYGPIEIYKLTWNQ